MICASEGNSAAVAYLVPRLPSHETLSWQRPLLGEQNDLVLSTPTLWLCATAYPSCSLLLPLCHSYYSNLATTNDTVLRTVIYALLSVLYVHVHPSSLHRNSGPP